MNIKTKKGKLKKQLSVEAYILEQVTMHAEMVILDNKCYQDATHILRYERNYSDAEILRANKNFMRALNKVLFSYKENIMDMVNKKRKQ